jgi:hypothetical protein
MFANRRNNLTEQELACNKTVVGNAYTMERCDAYRHFAAKCTELARTMDSPHDRSILLRMALVWSRLAEYTAKHVVASEPIESE